MFGSRPATHCNALREVPILLRVRRGISHCRIKNLDGFRVGTISNDDDTHNATSSTLQSPINARISGKHGSQKTREPLHVISKGL